VKTPSIREMRLASGLVLLLFVSTHLTNHALGLVSLDAMETGLGWFKLIWPRGSGSNSSQTGNRCCNPHQPGGCATSTAPMPASWTGH
jgi:hypothetical protein